ncbi:MAG: HzsA-related protein [Planctomycetota bacterium]
MTRQQRMNILCAILCGTIAASCCADELYAKKDTWQETMFALRGRINGQRIEAGTRKLLSEQIARDFPVEWDWVEQDCQGGFDKWLGGQTDASIEKRMIGAVLGELGGAGEELSQDFEHLRKSEANSDDRRWLDLYVRACEQRRALRFEPLLEKCSTIVFTKHFNMGGSHYAYTEAQSDAQHECNFVPGTALCLLEIKNNRTSVRTLINDPKGVIRDPDVSYDGKRILFSWKKSKLDDDYHLYEMDAETRQVRQLTFGLGFADYEGAYLPSGDIIFNSTRCVQIVDCWWTEVSNLYTCDKDGKYLRRLTFDQVHTNFPTVTADGRVIYTRWDYNDRAQIYPQGLFQMNADGTAQSEYYGNNSWFPTTILHARDIPGTQKLIAVLSGHHTHQRGKLAIIDARRGRQEASGIRMIAPVREAKAVRIDAYGQDGDQFQYPYPLSETEFLVTYDPRGSANKRYERPYAIYLMTIDGRRELLAADPEISCNQPVPLAARARPRIHPSPVDYRKKKGTFYIYDIYHGPGLAGIARGTIKRLRVVALDFRAAGIGRTSNKGPGGGALSSTPVGVGNACWDVKTVLGDATVYEDGSALFTVPARTPVYFQALDAKGHMVQTMRSWSTLQPGETFACTGCHENKNQAPPIRRKTMALETGPQTLEPFYGPPRGFSFEREIQPILDRRCIECHTGRNEQAFSLLAHRTTTKESKRRWSDSYLALTDATPVEKNGEALYYKGNPDGELVNWINTMSVPEMLPPYSGGAARSRLLTILEQGHEGVKLSREEMDKIACWIDLVVPFCGDYTEANAWSPEELKKYEHFMSKRKRMEQIEQRNIEALLAAKAGTDLVFAGER